jgi:uncharacterized protein YndB with AHSA1/START domain
MSESDDRASIQLSWELDHPPSKVWRALTEPELVKKWLMQTDLQLRVGKRFEFRQEPSEWWDGIVHSEVLELEIEKRISYAWKSTVGASKLDTVVTWTLEATPDGGTRLGLSHTGFVPKNKFAFQGAAQGWQQKINEGFARVLSELGA